MHEGAKILGAISDAITQQNLDKLIESCCPGNLTVRALNKIREYNDKHPDEKLLTLRDLASKKKRGEGDSEFWQWVTKQGKLISKDLDTLLFCHGLSFGYEPKVNPSTLSIVELHNLIIQDRKLISDIRRISADFVAGVEKNLKEVEYRLIEHEKIILQKMEELKELAKTAKK